MEWQKQCQDTGLADCAHASRELGVLAPARAAGQAPSGPLVTLLDDPRVAVEGEVSHVTVDGRFAQVVTVRVLRDVPAGLGCEVAVSACPTLFAGTTVRIAEITMSSARLPLMVWESWTTCQVATESLPAGFEDFLASMRFTP